MAGTPLGTVWVTVRPNMGNFNQLVNQHLQQTGNQTGAPAQNAGHELGKKLLAGIGAGVAGLGGLLAAGISNLREDTAIAAQTEAVIKSTGGAAHLTAQQMQDLATSIRDKTATDDAAVLSGENLLATFTNISDQAGKGNDIFTQATKVLVDMSRAMGTDTKPQAIQLGKALNDPVAGISALTRVGVTFTDKQKDLIKSLVDSGDTMGAQKIILGELNKEFGGSAEAYGKTLPGAIDKAQFAFDDFTETLAEHAVPAITDLAGIAQEKVLPALSDMVEQAAPAAEAIGKDLVGGVEKFAHVVAPGFRDAADAGQHFVHIVADMLHTVEPVGKALVALGLGAVAYGFNAVAKATAGTLRFLDRHKELVYAVVAAWAALKIASLTSALAALASRGIFNLVGAASSASGAVGGLVGQLRTLGGGSVVAGLGVGALAVGGFTLALSQLARDSRQRQQIKAEIEQIGAAADSLKPGSVRRVSEQLKQVAQDAAGAVDKNGKFIDSLLRIGNASREFDKVNADFARTNGFVKDLAHTYHISETAARGLATSHKVNLSDGLKTVQDDGRTAEQVFKDLSDKVKIGGTSSKDTAGALEKMGQKADGAASDIDTLNDKLDDLYGKNINAVEASDAFNSSLNDITDSVKNNKLALDDHTVAGLANRSAILSAANAAIQHNQAIVTQTGDLKAGQAAQDTDIQQLRLRAKATGLNTAAVDDLLRNLGLLPKKKDVPVSAPGAKNAKTEIDRLAGAIGSLQGKTVQIRIAEAVGGSLGRLAAATGGRVYGPGNDTSDTIPALLSPGEYVIRAAAARKVGYGQLAAINRMAAGGPVVRIPTSVPNSARHVAEVSDTFVRLAAEQVRRIIAAGGLGGGVGGGVAAVTATARLVLGLLHRPISELAAWVRRVMFESGGNATAVNRTDSNWYAGHPSVGQAQVIRGTFARWAGPFRNVGPFLYGVSTNPTANQYAGANYAIHTYGSLAAVDPLRRRGGYDKGGWLMPGETLAVNNTGRPERVLGPGESAGITQINNWTVTGDDPYTTAALIDQRIKDNNTGLVRMLRAGVGTR